MLLVRPKPNRTQQDASYGTRGNQLTSFNSFLLSVVFISIFKALGQTLVCVIIVQPC